MLPNAPDYLCTPTYDGSGQVVHPSLIDFWLEYGLPSWGGYRFWMAITPYPNGDDAYENPSLLVSQDGLNWSFPFGIPNPLDVKPGTRCSDPANYNSDPDLIFDPLHQCLVLYWRETKVNAFERIWSIRIHENRLIGPKILGLFEPFPEDTLIMSPSVWRKSESEWFMWTCNGHKIFMYTSNDGLAWGNRTECSLDFKNKTMEENFPWHLSVKPNYLNQRLEFFICGSSNRQKMRLWYAQASMNDLTKFIAPSDDFVLVPSQNPLGWDNDMIYRSAFTFENIEGLPYYHVWYSARSREGKWHLGYTEGSLG